MKWTRWLLGWWCMNAVLWAELEHPLEDHGGYHFQFSGHKYSLTMDMEGELYFSSKEWMKKDPSVAYDQRIKIHYVANRKEGGRAKGHRFKKIETQIKKKASSFSLMIHGIMTDQTNVSSLIEGDKYKVVMMTEVKCRPGSLFHLSFLVPEAIEAYPSDGQVLKGMKGNKTTHHVCSNIYDTKHFRERCRWVKVEKRNPLSWRLSAGASEGDFKVLQHSHDAGGVLNNDFTVYYSNRSKAWKAQKNTLVFQF